MGAGRCSLYGRVDDVAKGEPDRYSAGRQQSDAPPSEGERGRGTLFVHQPVRGRQLEDAGLGGAAPEMEFEKDVNATTPGAWRRHGAHSGGAR